MNEKSKDRLDEVIAMISKLLEGVLQSTFRTAGYTSQPQSSRKKMAMRYTLLSGRTQPRPSTATEVCRFAGIHISTYGA